MKKTLFFVLLAFSYSAFVSAQTSFLADRHAGYGLECAECHEVETPEKDAWVEGDKCLSCHIGRKDLAEKTKNRGKFNPHDNHLGEADCMICHHGHSPSSLYCVNCHNDLDPKMK